MFELTDDEISTAECNQLWYECSHAVARAQLAKVARMLPGLALETRQLKIIITGRLAGDSMDPVMQSIAIRSAHQQLEAVKKALEDG